MVDENPSSNLVTGNFDPVAFEAACVHQVYDTIADQFSATRYSPWPSVITFLQSQSPGAFGADVGCGNGKYLIAASQMVNNRTDDNHHLHHPRLAPMLALDRSSGLVQIVRNRGYDVILGDVLRLPYCAQRLDFFLCIAVLHHLSTVDRRLSALEELIRLLRPGGRGLIQVWAKEQRNPTDQSPTAYVRRNKQPSSVPAFLQPIDNVRLPVHVSGAEFRSTDVLVPWKAKQMKQNKGAKPSIPFHPPCRRHMFCVRDIRSSDLSTVYAFTLKLLRHHLGQYEDSLLGEEGLVSLFRDDYLRGLLLLRLQNDGNESPIGESDQAGSPLECNEPVGCMIYHADVSLLRGGHGIYLDQFFIEPAFRRQGLGRKMMSVLCQLVLDSGGQYVKLTYQDGLRLENVYGKLGFVNHTKSEPNLHLFEAYGKPSLAAFLRRGDLSTNGQSRCCCDQSQNTIPRVLVLPFDTPIPGSDFKLPTWRPVTPTNTTHHATSTNFFNSPPKAQMVLVAESSSNTCGSYAHNLTTAELLSQPQTRLCTFIEQCAVCSWLGPMVNFSDFVGDTTLLTTNLLLDRVRVWKQGLDQICGALWEVPINELRKDENAASCRCQPATASFNQSKLQTTLRQLGIPDDTINEGWNIVFLDWVGMRKLVDQTPVPVVLSGERGKNSACYLLT